MTEIRPDIRITYRVIAYDEGGYGDDRSKEFQGDQREEAIAYAKSLEARFGARVDKIITMQPMWIHVYP